MFSCSLTASVSIAELTVNIPPQFHEANFVVDCCIDMNYSYTCGTTSQVSISALPFVVLSFPHVSSHILSSLRLPSPSSCTPCSPLFPVSLLFTLCVPLSLFFIPIISVLYSLLLSPNLSPSSTLLSTAPFSISLSFIFLPLSSSFLLLLWFV